MYEGLKKKLKKKLDELTRISLPGTTQSSSLFISSKHSQLPSRRRTQLERSIRATRKMRSGLNPSYKREGWLNFKANKKS
jgi:hypothetical protein